MLNFTRRLALAALFLGIALPGAAAGAKLNYADHVRPIFREHCFNCHNQNKATNDLALDSYERLRKGGASGQAITPGDLDNSYLYAAGDPQGSAVHAAEDRQTRCGQAGRDQAMDSGRRR